MPDEPPLYNENKILIRPRLNELLEHGVKHDAITVIASLGYGKTTALKSFLQTKGNCIWLHLKTVHRTQQVFWEDMMAAIAEAKPSIADKILKYKLPQSLQDLEEYVIFINQEFKDCKQLRFQIATIHKVSNSLADIHKQKDINTETILSELQKNNLIFADFTEKSKTHLMEIEEQFRQINFYGHDMPDAKNNSNF